SLDHFTPSVKSSCVPLLICCSYIIVPVSGSTHLRCALLYKSLIPLPTSWNMLSMDRLPLILRPLVIMDKSCVKIKSVVSCVRVLSSTPDIARRYIELGTSAFLGAYQPQ